MKSNKSSPKKNVAQAMVEFAIVLPILLLLLYGLLETGRLLFIYSSIVTASRQAARYGATTGIGPSGVPNYQDCAGIRQAAQKVDFLNAFDDSDIYIYHDTGPGSTLALYCTGTTDTSYTPSGSITNPDRLVVRITGDFNAIVPKIVPFISRTVAKGNPITAQSARTIVMAIEIKPIGSGGPAATNITITPSIPQAEPGQTVTFTVTVSSGSGTPTGTVAISADGVGICSAVALTNGVGTCSMSFPTVGTKTVSATYTPDSSSFEASGPASISYVVGPSTTITTVTDTPDPSVKGNSVTITIVVVNQFPGGTTPTGTVTVSTAAGNCTFTLSGGSGGCAVTFNALGTSTITANYTPADTTKHKASSGSSSHEVLTGTPTPSSTPAPPTAVPTIATTPVPTAVTGCNSIRDSVGSIKLSGKTMSLTLTNTNPYPVVVSSVFVAWNYAAGHTPGDSSLWLQKADLGGTVFWTGNLNQPSALLPLSTTVTIPANSKPTITFTFDKTYSTALGEQIHIRFATPGCEAYPVIVPAGSPTITPGPSGSLKLQLISGGTDDTQQTQFRYQVQNTGSSAVSNISVRIYFTLDGTNAATSYVLEKFWDQSGVAAITGPTLASGNTYYFTIDYGGTSLALGNTWEFQTSLHLSSWASTYVSTNDWWHTSGTLPTSWTDWSTIPVYVNGSIAWGAQP